MRFLACVVLLGSLWSAAALAQQSRAGSPLATYVPAEPKDSIVTSHPEVADRLGREGWVVLSFVVSENGEVIEPVIEDSSGQAALEDAALEIVRGWSYEPARLEGAPVEQAMTDVSLVFAPEGRRGGEVSRAFRNERNEILELIRGGRLAEADERMAGLQSANLAEDAAFWWLRYAYLEALGDAERRDSRTTLRRALRFGTRYLEPDAIVLAAERLYALQVQDLDFRAAGRTFERLRNARLAQRSNAYDGAVGNMERHYQSLNALIEGDDLFAISAAVGEHGYWVHELSRRSFSLADVEGELETVDIRCTRGTRRYPFVSEDSAWNIPPSWGDCSVYVKGSEGATFNLYAYPPDEN